MLCEELQSQNSSEFAQDKTDPHELYPEFIAEIYL